MKVALSREYRAWMVALLPTTLGLGTAALWARSLNWPRSIDEDGLAFYFHRKVPWQSIRKIRVCRQYLDGQSSRIEIHHRRGVNKIPVRALRDGEHVARIILASFKQVRHAHPKGQVDVEVIADNSRHAKDKSTSAAQPRRCQSLAQKPTRSRFAA
jgi:hypothetical protein